MKQNGKPSTIQALETKLNPETIGPSRTTFSMQEAMLALDHLTIRGLLCTGCGYRLAVKDNQQHSHCDICVIPSQMYNDRSKTKRGSDFERILCKRLGEWVTTFLGTEGPKDGETSPVIANSSGN